jgi:hypothetical protein
MDFLFQVNPSNDSGAISIKDLIASITGSA